MTPKPEEIPAPEIPQDPAARRQMTTRLLYEAGVHRSKGELDSAVVAFSQAIELDPNSFSAYNNRGLTFLEKGALKDAIGDFTEAIRLQPDRAFVYTNRATAYQRLGELENAIADYSTAVEIDDDLAGAYFQRGNCFFQAEIYDKAIEDYDRALDINRRYKEAKDNKRLAQEKLKEQRRR